MPQPKMRSPGTSRFQRTFSLELRAKKEVIFLSFAFLYQIHTATGAAISAPTLPVIGAS